MSIIVPFPMQPQGSWLCTIELYRKPGGEIVARLIDMPPKVIEDMADTVSERMARLSLWTQAAANSFLAQAADFADTDQEPAHDPR